LLPETRRGNSPSKGKQQEKYCGGTAVKIEGANPYERYVDAEQDCLAHHLR